MGKVKDDQIDTDMELWPASDLTPLEMEEMRLQALLSDLSLIIDEMDEVLVENKYYGKPVTAETLTKFRTFLHRSVKNFS